jgi:hypothetical protein
MDPRLVAEISELTGLGDLDHQMGVGGEPSVGVGLRVVDIEVRLGLREVTGDDGGSVWTRNRSSPCRSHSRSSLRRSLSVIVVCGAPCGDMT